MCLYIILADSAHKHMAGPPAALLDTTDGWRKWRRGLLHSSQLLVAAASVWRTAAAIDVAQSPTDQQAWAPVCGGCVDAADVFPITTDLMNRSVATGNVHLSSCWVPGGSLVESRPFHIPPPTPPQPLHSGSRPSVGVEDEPCEGAVFVAVAAMGFAAIQLDENLITGV